MDAAVHLLVGVDALNSGAFVEGAEKAVLAINDSVEVDRLGLGEVVAAGPSQTESREEGLVALLGQAFAGGNIKIISMICHRIRFILDFDYEAEYYEHKVKKEKRMDYSARKSK